VELAESYESFENFSQLELEQTQPEAGGEGEI
jgi:hypothetical protein